MSKRKVKVAVHFRCHESVLTQVQAIAAVNGITQSAVIERSLLDFVVRQGQEPTRYIPQILNGEICFVPEEWAWGGEK